MKSESRDRVSHDQMLTPDSCLQKLDANVNVEQYECLTRLEHDTVDCRYLRGNTSRFEIKAWFIIPTQCRMDSEST